MRQKLYLLLLFVFISVAAHAQYMHGIVTDAENGKPIALADVQNTTTRQVVHTDQQGSYNIFARPGDTINFTGIGYRRVQKLTTRATASVAVVMLPMTYEFDDVTFKFNSLTKYQKDSAERAAIYKVPLRQKPANALNSPASAVAELFSKKAQEKYKFQRDFAATEDQKFIDTRYTPEVVAVATKLTGDSIAFFMFANPMPYEYVRTASDLEIKMWIREHFKTWMKK